jgi:2-polyprenyl-3-methyl-5-hydroxy-6-metoxy-1,4-benzoquinol methylase
VEGIIDVANNIGVRSILDCGCGKGQAMYALNHAGFDVHGVDITLDGVNVNLGKEHFTESPLSELPFSNCQYDMAVCVDVLEHIPKNLLSDSISEMARVCKHAMVQVYLNKDGYGKLIGETLHKSLLTESQWESLLNEHYRDVAILEAFGSRRLFWCDNGTS